MIIVWPIETGQAQLADSFPVIRFKGGVPPYMEFT